MARGAPRWGARILVALVATFWLVPADAGADTPPPAATAPAAPIDATATGFQAGIDVERARAGAPTLHRHPELDRVAQQWAEQMAAAGEISHSDLPARVDAPWRALGENVGTGPSVERIHRAFMRSPSHRRNILQPAYDYLGIGVAVQAGRIYVAQVFMTGGYGRVASGDGRLVRAI